MSWLTLDYFDLQTKQYLNRLKNLHLVNKIEINSMLSLKQQRINANNMQIENTTVISAL